MSGLLYLVALSFGIDLKQLTQKSDSGITLISSLVGLLGALLGFEIAAVTFLFGLVDKPAFQVLRQSHSYNQFWDIFRSTLRSTGASTLISITCLFLLYADRLPIWAAVALIFSVLWTAVRLARSIWSIENLIAAEVLVGKRQREERDKQNIAAQKR